MAKKLDKIIVVDIEATCWAGIPHRWRERHAQALILHIRA